MRAAGLIAQTTPDSLQAEGSRPAWSRATALELMHAAFESAVARVGLYERTFRVAGRVVKCSFAGPELIPAIEPALAHLASEPSPDADLDVRIWDSASTEVPVPAPPREHSVTPERTKTRETDSVRSSYQAEPRILTVYDPRRRVAVVWVPDARSVPSNEVASPLRTLLHWWARDNGLQFVHAGAVGQAGRAVLLAGPSGAGKSTTTLAALLGGLDYLGDDYVLIERAGTTIHSLFSAAKLQPGQVAAFPELRQTLSNADRLASEKALWFVHRDFPERTKASGEATAILVPRISGRVESSVVPIARSTALAALAPSTIAQLSGSDQWSLDAIAGFVSRVAAFRLEAGTDLRGLARAVRGVIEAAGEPA